MNNEVFSLIVILLTSAYTVHGLRDGNDGTLTSNSKYTQQPLQPPDELHRRSEDGGQGVLRAPLKFGKNIFRATYVKFGHFFWQKLSKIWEVCK